MITPDEARQIALEAVKEWAALNPPLTSYTVKDAAEALGVSTKTIMRLNLPRNQFGRINYEDLQRARSSKC